MSETDPRAFQPGSLVAAYLRDSGGKKQDLSVGQQEEAIRKFCQANGLILSQVFKDEARSGKSTAGRDDFDRMAQHFEADGAPEAGILFWDYSRWARNFDDGQFFLASIRRKGYKAFSLEEQVPNGPMGRVVEAFHLAMAEEYRLQLSRNVKRSMYDLTLKYNAYFSNCPAGYKFKPVEIGMLRDGTPRTINQLEPDPETAPKVKRAFELRASGRTMYEIHTYTHIYGDINSYRWMLRRHIYYGRHVWGGLDIPGFCEPIVDLETWNRVQAINEQNAKRHGPGHPRRAGSRYLLTGLVHCQVCGHPMGGASATNERGKRYWWYQCAGQHMLPMRCPAKRIPAALLDGRVTDRLVGALSDPDLAWRWYEQARSQAVELAKRAWSEEDELKRLLSTNRAATNRITKMLELAETDEPDALRPLLESLGRLGRERDELLSRAAQAGQASRGPALPVDLTPDQAVQVAQAAAGKLKDADFRERQLALRSMIVDIVVVKGADGGLIGRVDWIPPFSDGTGESLDLA